jgi:hypothetical protein
MGLPPNYGSMRGDGVDMTDKWTHLVSDVENDVSTPVKINQDANIYVSELGPGKTYVLRSRLVQHGIIAAHAYLIYQSISLCPCRINFKVEQGRQAYYLQMEGSAKVTGE